MVNHNYTKEDLIDAIVAARTSYLPWAHILAMEIDRLTVELAVQPRSEERKSTWGFSQYTLELPENKENE